MKLTYTNVNGYLIPNLTYKSGEQLTYVTGPYCHDVINYGLVYQRAGASKSSSKKK